MENNSKPTPNEIIAEFCKGLDERRVGYELNNNDGNLLRFRAKLPNHNASPLVLVHFNPENNALSLALSKFVVFGNPNMEIYKLINDFNSDQNNFGCKLFIDTDGDVIVLTNAIAKGDNICKQIEEYLEINVLAIDNYFDRISEIINNADKD